MCEPLNRPARCDLGVLLWVTIYKIAIIELHSFTKLLIGGLKGEFVGVIVNTALGNVTDNVSEIVSRMLPRLFPKPSGLRLGAKESTASVAFCIKIACAKYKQM